jgi:glutamate racemase
MIHSGDAIVEYLEKEFKFKEKFSKPKIEFFASENPESIKAIAHKWLNI